jgi:hypothetical protein
VTSASPIIRAAAVEAVRCGLRRAFSVPTRDVERSGITPGNSIGHSGSQLLTAFRIHITEHDREQERVEERAAENATMRRPIRARPARSVAQEPARQREERPHDRR